MSDEIPQQVFKLVESYNGYWFWLGKRFPLTTNTDLNKDFRMAPEDAAELLESFAEMFAIAPETIDFGKYFPADFSDADAPLTIFSSKGTPTEGGGRGI